MEALFHMHRFAYWMRYKRNRSAVSSCASCMKRNAYNLRFPDATLREATILSARAIHSSCLKLFDYQLEYNGLVISAALPLHNVAPLPDEVTKLANRSRNRRRDGVSAIEKTLTIGLILFSASSFVVIINNNNSLVFLSRLASSFFSFKYKNEN